MAVTTYRTYNGRLRAEVTDGVRTTYLTDALGSVTATVDSSQTVLNTYRYKPSGDLLAKTGSSPDPRFLWTGDTGSRTTGLAYSEQYNRLRHYGSKQAAWTTVDPIWPVENAYVYVRSKPVTSTDPMGLSGITQQNCISLQLPIPPSWSIGMEYCNWCYDPRCCGGGEWASRCWSIAGNATFTIKAVPWDEIGGTVRRTAEAVLRILVGGAAGINECLHPQKDCVSRSQAGDMSVCLRVCATAVSMSCCVGLTATPKGVQLTPITCSVSYGYCGLPSASIRIRVRSKTCE